MKLAGVYLLPSMNDAPIVEGNRCTLTGACRLAPLLDKLKGLRLQAEGWNMHPERYELIRGQ